MQNERDISDTIIQYDISDIITQKEISFSASVIQDY